jgi:hypothetical protein
MNDGPYESPLLDFRELDLSSLITAPDPDQRSALDRILAANECDANQYFNNCIG